MRSAFHTFRRHYLACALWTANDGENDEIQLDRYFSTDDISRDWRQQATRDCLSFYRDNAATWRAHGWSDEQAGHDFSLTRNGHGSGFWDRHFRGEYETGECPAGRALSDACKPYGESDLTAWDMTPAALAEHAEDVPLFAEALRDLAARATACDAL